MMDNPFPKQGHGNSRSWGYYVSGKFFRDYPCWHFGEDDARKCFFRFQNQNRFWSVFGQNQNRYLGRNIFIHLGK